MEEGTGENLQELLSSMYEVLGLALDQVGHPYKSFFLLLRRRLRRALS